MEKYNKIENYIPLGLLILLFLNSFLFSEFRVLFIFYYILVGVFLAINTWRMNELNTVDKDKWNLKYYSLYVGIFVFSFIFEYIMMISQDSGV